MVGGGGWIDAAGFVVGLALASLTTPVGVSGAVFLLPVQLSVLGVPSPAVTPTNLLFNVVAGPGALARYRRGGELSGPLARRLVAGTVPGVVAGAAVRVFAVPGVRVFRLLVALFLLPVGVSLWIRTLRPRRNGGARELPGGALSVLAVAVGVVGGVYGIGGGSILGPVLAGRGLPLAKVAPAALACTFVTSVTGAAAFALLALAHRGQVAPNWLLGICCGAGGLVGGYLGALIQPRIPETALKLLLGALAVALAGLYLAQAL